MREAVFIKQNTEKWKTYENTPAITPDDVAERFIIITDDLAYSKTFYPKSKTTEYLNKLATGYHQDIYKNKKENTNRILFFWKFELPLLFKKHHKQLLYSFLFFTVFFLMGLLSAKYDKTFVSLILGDDYVNMTNANIAKGDPFGVYKNGDSFAMLYAIARNNLYITVLNFVTGIFCAFGTLYILLNNGLMLGAFEYLFISKGLGLQSTLVIWIHGTLEISTIIIAGSAGLVLGKSVLFPTTFSRAISIKKGASDGMKIIVGILPIVVIAAIFESFVTRHTEMPVWLSAGILLVSFSFITWYVILYPLYLHHKISTTNSQNNEPEN
ncbi:stage II sporulation protein M [Mucilaginibacter corticis]|uniref:Stage II sporulation protein M n=1 Tax=Mucilaginibacter corticis TaxID=2597670 RepID=A0A556MS66_9SPHI|nr:stage II sporulation protein M [Mucilaginibacter corticis]TSJ42811.1 stage II sporulation protein M [Mucilaginibacter corticis]